MKRQLTISALALTAFIAAVPVVHADKAGKGARAVAAKAPAANAKTVVLAVSKMDCESCANGLVQAATHWNGVKSANVSFAQKRALVTFDPTKTSATKIAREFTRIGFPTKVVQ